MFRNPKNATMVTTMSSGNQRRAWMAQAAHETASTPEKTPCATR